MAAIHRESYTLDTSGLDEKVKAEAAACGAKWDKKAKNGSIDKFDAASGKFVFAGEENGFAIDRDKLAADISQALKDKKFDAKITATGSDVAPEISAASAKENIKPSVLLQPIPQQTRTVIPTFAWQQRLLMVQLLNRDRNFPLTVQ